MPLIDPYDHDDSTPPPFRYSLTFAVGMALILTVLILIA